MKVERGEIFMADLGDVSAFEQSNVQKGYRPVVIIQSNITSKNSNVVVVAPVTTTYKKSTMRTHVKIGGECGISKKSVVLLEQIQTIDKYQLNKKIGKLDSEKLKEIKEAIIFTLDL